MRSNPPRSGSQRLVSSWIRWFATIGASAALLTAMTAVAPFAPVDPLVAYALGFAFVAGSAIAVGHACPRVHRRTLWLLVFPIGALALLGEHRTTGAALAAGVAAALLCGGSLLGTIVGREVEHAGYLVFVAVVSSAMDLVSVFHPTGPSAMLATSPRAISLLAVPWPMLGTSEIEPFLGVGDVVFTALYLAACRRHGLSESRTVVALVMGFVATALTVIVLARPVPALPLLGAAVVGIHAEARHPPATDRMRGIVVAASVVLICLGLLVFRLR